MVLLVHQTLNMEYSFIYVLFLSLDPWALGLSALPYYLTSYYSCDISVLLHTVYGYVLSFSFETKNCLVSYRPQYIRKRKKIVSQ